MNSFNTLLTAAVTTATLSLAAGTASAATLLALGADGQLFKIDSSSQKVTATMATNSPSPLRGIDVRPANGMLYALSNDHQLHTLDLATGAASKVASLNKQLPGSGQAVLDFNPVADKLRMLVVWTEDRSPRFPTAPTLLEMGHKIVSASPYGLAGPKGMDPRIVKKLHDALKAGLAASSFFPVILLGIFSTRINREGAIAGMLAGLVFTISYISYFKFISPELNTADHWWWGISPEGIGTLGMALNFLFCFGVSYLTPPPPKNVQELIQEIRIPTGAGKAYDH